jgi:hypothetical protein
VPLLGHFNTTAKEIPAHDIYDNHPAVANLHAAVEEKFVKEEEKSFYFHLPCFLIYFLYSLILAPLQWALRKGKGRICVDCTKGPDLKGSANSSIPKPSDANADKCPLVFYQQAFACHIRHLWRMRLTYPHEDLLQHTMISKRLSAKCFTIPTLPLSLRTSLVTSSLYPLAKFLAPNWLHHFQPPLGPTSGSGLIPYPLGQFPNPPTGSRGYSPGYTDQSCRTDHASY